MANCRPEPDGIPSKGERRAASRQPVGTQVKREFRGGAGQLKVFRGLRRAILAIRYPDGDGEELNNREMRRGRQKVAEPPPLSLNSEYTREPRKGVERSRDNNGNKQLPRHRYTSRRGPPWGGAYGCLHHLLGSGREGRAKIVRLREPSAHAVSWERREVSGPPVYPRLREPLAQTEGLVSGGERE